MNLSDTEIKKALECCSAFDCEICVEDKCPYHTGQEMYPCNDIKIAKDALDLINRLQADKEALIAGQETLQKCIAEKMAEIERYKGVIKILEKDISVARAEGVKEFWNKLKKKAFGILDVYSSISVVDIADGDNLVKEMAGD